MKRLCISMPDSVHAKLKRESKKRDQTIAAMIRQAVADFFKARPAPKR